MLAPVCQKIYIPNRRLCREFFSNSLTSGRTVDLWIIGQFTTTQTDQIRNPQLRQNITVINMKSWPALATTRSAHRTTEISPYGLSQNKIRISVGDILKERTKRKMRTHKKAGLAGFVSIIKLFFKPLTDIIIYGIYPLVIVDSLRKLSANGPGKGNTASSSAPSELLIQKVAVG